MKNIVLTGFMGTGKTAVGRMVAQRLGREFVDMDEQIEETAKATVSEIFVRDGQEAFRGMEDDLCRKLSERRDLVIATGGGTLIDSDNRERMISSGTVICLVANAEQIMRQLGSTDVSKRPLLGTSDLKEAIESLLHARREIYRSFPWQIDTSNMTIADVARRVIEIAEHIAIPVRYPGGEYKIMISGGLLDHLGWILQEKVNGRIAIVTNTVVAPLYGARVEEALRAAGFDPFTCVIPDGEAHKNLKTVDRLYEKFLTGGLDRAGTVVALGGGVTGDIAGFAAATFMRGIKLIEVPTSLLAMIDASVGGKTGVDLPQGKNLVGSFKQPSLVLIDPRVLSTLPDEEVGNGAAEAIKHGIIADPELFATLENGPVAFTTGLIARILKVKVRIVEQDPYERGQRETLNLGHTVAHAIEQVTEFTVPHGRAVAIGLVAAARIAVQLKLADHDLVKRIETALSAWGLPVTVPDLPTDDIIVAMRSDKKTKNGQVRFILPRRIGTVEVADDVPPELIRSVLQQMQGRC